MIICAVFFTFLAASNAASFSETFGRCKITDDDCIKKASQNGLTKLTKAYPEFGLVCADPLSVTQLSIPVAQNGVFNLDPKYSNCNITGISTTKFDIFRFDRKERTIYVEGQIPKLQQLCDYEINGKLLLLPIVGSGKSSYTLENTKIKLTFKMDEVTKKGQIHYKVHSHKLSLDPEAAEIVLENLFNGDATLSNQINKVLAENSKPVFEESRPAYEEAYGLILQTLINGLVAKIPLKDFVDL